MDRIVITIAMTADPLPLSGEGREVVIDQLKRLPWKTLQDDMEIFKRKRGEMTQDKGVFIRVEHGNEGDLSLSWAQNELKRILEVSFSREARSIIRYT